MFMFNLFISIHGNMGDYAWGAEGLDNILTALLNQFTDGHQARTLSQEGN
jgi:hypothetical protein